MKHCHEYRHGDRECETHLYPTLTHKTCALLGVGYQEVLDERVATGFAGATYEKEIERVLEAYDTSFRHGMVAC